MNRLPTSATLCGLMVVVIAGFASAQSLTVLDGLNFWLKADSFTNNQPVTSWTDSSPNVVVMVPTAPVGSTPFCSTNPFGGRPAIVLNDPYGYRGTSGDEQLTNMTPLTAFSAIQRLTYFLVSQTPLPNQVGFIFLIVNDDNPNKRQGLRPQLWPGYYYDVPVDGNTWDAYSSPPPTVKEIHAMVFDGTASSNEAALRVFQNGNPTTLTFEDWAPPHRPTALANSSWMTISGRGDRSDCYRGAIAELLIYNRKLDNADINDVHTYLGAKYGISVNLLPERLKGTVIMVR